MTVQLMPKGQRDQMFCSYFSVGTSEVPLGNSSRSPAPLTPACASFSQNLRHPHEGSQEVCVLTCYLSSGLTSTQRFDHRVSGAAAQPLSPGHNPSLQCPARMAPLRAGHGLPAPQGNDRSAVVPLPLHGTSQPEGEHLGWGFHRAHLQGWKYRCDLGDFKTDIQGG